MPKFQKLAATAAAVATTIGAIAISRRIGAAGNIARSGEGSYCVDDGLGLRHIAKLELSSLQIISQFLDGVLSHQSPGSSTIFPDGIYDVAGVAGIFIPDRVNVAVGLTAALLRVKPGLVDVLVDSIEALTQVFLNSVEPIQHASVHGVEAITQTVLQAVELAHDVLVVESSLDLSAGSKLFTEVPVSKAAPSAVSPGQKEEQEEHPHSIPPEQAIVIITTIAVRYQDSLRGGHATARGASHFHTHFVLPP